MWTPCGRSAEIHSGELIATADVVLDPGHGGDETGAVGPAGTREADLNLALARRAAAALEADGLRVVLTRDDDVRLPIVTRAEIARALAPIAFVSLHHNGGTDAPSTRTGAEIYHQIASTESRRLGGLVYEEIRAVLDAHDVAWVALEDAGVMTRPDRSGRDYYGVLRRSGDVTSVLAEFGYLTNPAEEALLTRADVQDELAQALRRAFERFTSTTDPGSGFSDDPFFRGFESSGTGRTTNCDDPALER
ncbi:MAG: N-acetylmuramoyl-L-alanine amidase [Acidimicrobiales bacterium]